MFDYIKGILTDKSYPYCTVECNGIGYRLLTNQRTLQNIGELNSEVKIYTKLIHKEDSMTLCGFKNKQDRVIFDTLTSVSGIGTKVALALLAEFDTNVILWKYIATLQLFGLIFAYTLFYPGMNVMADKGMGGMCYPMLVGSCIVSFTLSSIWLLKEKLRPVQLAALIVCIAGLILICTD